MADLSVPIDMREITVTPVFRYETIEDINASERAGHLVTKVRQVVEVRFAGSRNYSPVFPVDAFWKREGGRVITYAERWPDQYRQFLDGGDQQAAGTPLEMLRPYGIKDSQLSLCRALKIYSIEALYHLEGDALKSLQMSGNDLKNFSRRFMADRAKGTETADEVARLRAEIEILKASTSVPEKEPTPGEIETAIAASDAEYEAMSNAELKSVIREKTGRAPSGTPSRSFLINAVKELTAA